MESFSGDTEENTEDIPGRKKSKLKSLKTRLFGRSKRAGGEGNAKLSQSESDITAGKALGSDEDLSCSQGMMGSRALSHDSIFLADEVLTDAEPARVLSQENVHSKIKALQMKLQQQKMHLGPPPLVLPIRRPEDLGSRSEDDGLPHSPSEILGADVTNQGALSKTISQPPSCPLSPIPKPVPTKTVPQTPSLPLPLSVTSKSSVVEPPLDFSSPAQFTPCLDTSAARHRMSVKPRNQRASTKKRPAADDSRSHLHTLNNINHPESVREDERRLSTQEEVTLETEQGGSVTPITAQCLLAKSPEVAPITSEAASKSSSLTFSQQDQALPERVPSVPSQVLRVKPHRPADVMSSERPRSSFIQSELKDKREGDFEIQVMPHDKKNTLNKAGMAEVSLAFRSSSVHQQIEGETESTRGIKRPPPGSGSFHFSITTAKNRDEERPRSGSFVGVLEQTEARHQTEDKPFSKEELRDLPPRGGPFAVGRLRQEGALHKIPVLPWDRRDSLKKVESVTPSTSVTTDTGTAEVVSSQEVVEEAVEAQEVEEEGDGKTAFGIKLRSTSQSTRFRSDASSNHNPKPPVREEQGDKQKGQEISNNASYMSKKLSTSIPCTPPTSVDLRLTDPTTCGLSLPLKHNLPSTGNPYIMPTEVQTTSSNPKEVETALVAPQDPQPAPQTASSEMSWMSLAMEKTRSFQQLFTSKFPRDFTGGQTAARPQAQVQTTNQTETPTGTIIQTQTVKIQQSATPLEAANQPSTDAVIAETVQSRSQAQAAKPSLMAVQQKTSTASPAQSIIYREQQTSKQTNEPQSHPYSTQSAAIQADARTTQSPLYSSTQTETSSQFAQGSVTQSLAQSYLASGQQQPPWSNRGLPSTTQLKSTTSALTSVSTTSSATAPAPVSASGRGEREATMQEKEGASLSGRRTVWAGSISEKAAFLEKRAEWTTPPGTKGVELKKAQREAQTSGESPDSAKTTPLSKDTKQEGRQGVKPAESSPYKVPDRPRDDKWLRKNVPSSSSPSSSPTMPSVLQSTSDNGQPSWMELAKRKSMAWSDKSME
ncbi:serine-rich adhesin for platelets [Enoplosus armatus]|uniref:serine-rich adhesin for platelets n=1 Tax=Enoplosus armatus TaxID=215367 RepID=UPI0039953B8C